MGMNRGTKTARYFRGTPEERFWHYTDITPDHWWWTGSVLKDKEGNPTYGSMGVGWIPETGKSLVVLAHRFSLELYTKESIEPGLEVDHLCKVKLCVNPRHLEAVTRSINVLRGEGPNSQRVRHAARTHCIRNHPLSGDNIRFDRDGCRVCRTCMRDHQREFRKRKRSNL
jgi:hypothetical protein